MQPVRKRVDRVQQQVELRERAIITSTSSSANAKGNSTWRLAAADAWKAMGNPAGLTTVWFVAQAKANRCRWVVPYSSEEVDCGI